MDMEIQQLAVLKKELTNDERMQFDMPFASRRKGSPNSPQHGTL